MDHHAAAGWPTAVMAPLFMLKSANGVPYDPFSIQGADHWYTDDPGGRSSAASTSIDRTYRGNVDTIVRGAIEKDANPVLRVCGRSVGGHPALSERRADRGAAAQRRSSAASEVYAPPSGTHGGGGGGVCGGDSGDCGQHVAGDPGQPRGTGVAARRRPGQGPRRRRLRKIANYKPSAPAMEERNRAVAAEAERFAGG